MKIVIINGAGNSGKDTFIRCCQEVQPELRIGNLSLITPVKQMFPSATKSCEYRKHLETVLRSWMSFNQEPMNILFDAVGQSMKQEMDIVFCHIRQVSYIKMFLSKYQEAKTLHIDTITRPLELQTIADRNTANMEYDFKISNNGSIEDLMDKASGFLYAIL